MGYTRISSSRRGVAVVVDYFVPLGETCEVWRVRLINENAAPVRLQLFAAVEFCLWDAWDDQTNFQRNFNTGEVEVAASASVIYHKTEYRERRDHFAYFACSAPTAGYDTQREAFLGPYRGWDHPQAVEEGRCRNSVAHGWSPVGVHQVDAALEPGETREVVFVLGYAENPRDAKFLPDGRLNATRAEAVIARYSDAAALDAACRRPAGVLGSSSWASCTSKPRTSTPTGWSTSGTRTR